MSRITSLLHLYFILSCKKILMLLSGEFMLQIKTFIEFELYFSVLHFILLKKTVYYVYNVKYMLKYCLC
ncbi:hypothetical protein X975_26568, partial [Stegodyphus mimosarum]